MTQPVSTLISESRFTSDECSQILGLVAEKLTTNTLTEAALKNLVNNACSDMARLKKIKTKIEESKERFDISKKDVVVLLILMHDSGSITDISAVDRAKKTYDILFPTGNQETKRKAAAGPRNANEVAIGPYVAKIRQALGKVAITTGEQTQIASHLKTEKLTLPLATLEQIRAAADKVGIDYGVKPVETAAE